MVFETFRSQDRELDLFDQCKSQLHTVGVHHYGLACDLVRDVCGQPSWEGDFSFLKVIARRHKLIWGGDWGTPCQAHKLYDAVHVQRCTVARQRALFRGEWYPDDDYDPYEELEGITLMASAEVRRPSIKTRSCGAGTPAREQLVGSVVANWPINTGLIESGLTLSGVIETRL